MAMANSELSNRWVNEGKEKKKTSPFHRHGSARWHLCHGLSGTWSIAPWGGTWTPKVSKGTGQFAGCAREVIEWFWNELQVETKNNSCCNSLFGVESKALPVMCADAIAWGWFYPWGVRLWLGGWPRSWADRPGDVCGLENGQGVKKKIVKDRLWSIFLLPISPLWVAFFWPRAKWRIHYKDSFLPSYTPSLRVYDFLVAKKKSFFPWESDGWRFDGSLPGCRPCSALFAGLWLSAQWPQGAILAGAVRWGGCSGCSNRWFLLFWWFLIFKALLQILLGTIFLLFFWASWANPESPATLVDSQSISCHSEDYPRTIGRVKFAIAKHGTNWISFAP